MTRANAAWLHWPQTQQLVKAFGGNALRFVGGCVRDALLGRPVRDIDAATPLPPEEVMRLLEAGGVKTFPTGLKHGTVTALVDGVHFEITTLRRDVKTDGRHAEVAFTDDWAEDAQRRDFTMNALFCDARGEVSDYTGGAQDALEGRVRFIGDASQRISEDALRILRFFRFYAHYGQGPLDEAGLAACARHAGMIDALSGERIQQEMLKLLVAENAAQVVEAMQGAGVWARVAPAATHTKTLARLPAIRAQLKLAPDALPALALLLRAGGGSEASAQHIAKRWKLSNADGRRLQDLCRTAPLPAGEAERKAQIRRLGNALCIAQAVLRIAEGGNENEELAHIAFAQRWEAPAFPVSGTDLKALGLSEGRELGEALRRLTQLWEEGGCTDDKQTLLGKL